MSASSISVATAAIAASSHSLSSTYRNLKSYPVLISTTTNKNPLKLKIFKSYAPFYPPANPLRNWVSTSFDTVEATPDEDDTVVKGENVEEEEVPSQSSDAGRLYVGNLPFTTTSAELTEIFSQAGQVVSVEVITGKGSSRSRGFAFVTMGSVEEAKEAIRLFDSTEIGGREAKVNFPEVPRGGESEFMSLKARSSNKGYVDSPHKIYAANLNWGITSQALREAFAEQPGFLGAKVIFDRETGRSRGFGFITFSSEQEVESALRDMNGVEVEGRPLRLELAGQRS